MPAAAVIPAPIAYIKVVAVKKLVVEFLVWGDGPLNGENYFTGPPFWGSYLYFTVWVGEPGLLL